jgi:hypothetical protein
MRNLKELLGTRTTARPAIIHVSADEGRLLATSGASVSSRLNSTADGETWLRTQTYDLGNKQFQWIERKPDDQYPVQ